MTNKSTVTPLFRLEGGLSRFPFPLQGGGEVVILAHAPTAEEISASTLRAGLEDIESSFEENDEGERVWRSDLGRRDELEIILKQSVQSVELACFCIEDVEGVEGAKIHRVRGDYGLEELSPESRAMFPREALKEVGIKLLEVSNTTEEENFPSAPVRSGATTES